MSYVRSTTQEQIYHSVLPVQVFEGWAEGDHWGGQGLWDAAVRGAVHAAVRGAVHAAVRGAVWSDVGEDRCGRLAAAGDDDGDDGVDREDDYVDVDDVVGQDWSSPNEAPPHLLSKEINIDDGSNLLNYIYLHYFGKK